MLTNSFWNNNSPLQHVVKQLEALIPTEGAVLEPRKNKALEKFRVAANCYYDLYNNGLCNRASQFARVFGIASSHYKQPWRGYGYFDATLYAATEEAMTKIVIAAANEQKIVW